MQYFILSRSPLPSGEHEVHNASIGDLCLPAPDNQHFLGQYLDCRGAMSAARHNWPSARINGCVHCCPACHAA